jgi:hypothetical protein
MNNTQPANWTTPKRARAAKASWAEVRKLGTPVSERVHESGHEVVEGFCFYCRRDVESAPITCAECGAEDVEYLPHNEGCPR